MMNVIKSEMDTAADSEPMDEGIVVKSEYDNPETDRSIKENLKKTENLRTWTDSSGSMNIASKPVPLFPIAMPELKLGTSESAKGKFGFEEIKPIDVPFIIRIVDKKPKKFIPLRIAEKGLYELYLKYLHSDIRTYVTLKCYVITEIEEKLLNDINRNHSGRMYGKKPFVASIDRIVELEDIKEYFNFIEVCFNKLLCRTNPEWKKTCGFIRINSDAVLPYSIKDEKMYVPLFYFEGERENLGHSAIKLKSWSLAYLKFCCRILNIRKELYSGDFCLVVCLEDVKCYFPPETDFEDFWPANVILSGLIRRYDFPFAAPSPNDESVPESNLQQNLGAAAAPNMQFSTNDINQKGSSSNFTESAILPPNDGSMENACQLVDSPPPVSSSETTIVVTVSYSDNLPTSQTMTITDNPMSHIIQFSSDEPNDNTINTQQLGNFTAVMIVQPREIVDSTLSPSSNTPHTTDDVECGNI